MKTNVEYMVSQKIYPEGNQRETKRCKIQKIKRYRRYHGKNKLLRIGILGGKKKNMSTNCMWRDNG